MKKILLLLLPAAALISSCNFAGKRVKGNGHVSTEERSVAGFDGVRSSGSFDLYVSQGPQSLRIEAEENLLPYIETHVEDGILRINTKNNTWLRSTRDIKIYATAPNFKLIRSSGSGDIKGQTKLTHPERIEVGISGSADINIDVDAPEVEAEITGSGNVDVKGTTRVFKARISGSGNIKASDLQSEESEIRITGSGDASVYASVKLDVRVTGSGNVRYKGGAQVNSQITGGGGVSKID